MFLIKKSLYFLIATCAAMVVAIVAVNSQELIFSKNGCWPKYGDTIVHYGMVAMYSLLPVLSFFIAATRHWIKPNNSILRNVIGYAGGCSAGFFITFVTFGVIGTYMAPSFEYRFGYPVC